MFRQDFDEYDTIRKRGRGGFAGRFHGSEEAFGGFRAGRGMMEPAILLALLEKPMHGYEIISHLEEKSHGIWRPSPGSVYPTLQLLEEKDDVKVQEKDGKKVYELTTQGKERAEEVEHLRAHWKEDFADRLRNSKNRHKVLGEVMRLMRDIFHKGTSEQNEALNEAINAFKKRLEQIKSEGL